MGNVENGDPKIGASSSLQVKCLEYSRPLLCVAFNDVDFILVYRLSIPPSSSPSTSSEMASLVQTLPFSSRVWDCKFATDGSLYVLTTEQPHLRRFCAAANLLVEADLPTLSFDDADAEDSSSALAASLEAALKTPSLFAVLTKSKIDNMKAYLETKEKRLAGGNARWAGRSPPKEKAVVVLRTGR